MTTEPSFTETCSRLEELLRSTELPGARAHGLLAPRGRPLEPPETGADMGPQPRHAPAQGPEARSGGNPATTQPQGPDSLQQPEHHRPLHPLDPLAAVLILLYPDGEEGEPHIPLILRPEDETPHAGQIALPGGRREGDEAYPLATALRESREELGIPGELIRPIGTLSPLYVGVSHVTVTPVVGCAKERPPFEPDRREVDVCFSIPVSSFFQRPLWGEFDARGISIPAPYYPTEAGKVWGATAMMLSELISIWEEIVYK